MIEVIISTASLMLWPIALIIIANVKTPHPDYQETIYPSVEDIERFRSIIENTMK